MDDSTIYIRLKKRAYIGFGETITLGQIAGVLCPSEMESSLKNLVLLQPSEHDGQKILIDMLMIVKKIKEVFPTITIECYGEPHVLIEVEKTRNPRTSNVLVFLVCLLLGIGSGLAILNFHVDVSMLEVHERIAEMITGDKTKYLYWLQVPYSLGIAIGMLLFFNRFCRKKFNEEPSPLDVEMFLYDENVNRYCILEEYRKQQVRDRR